MNKKDLVIMSYLRQDSRSPLTEISRKTGVPVSTIYEKIKRTGPGIITRNTCLVDFTKLGFHARANLALQASIALKKELLDFLVKHCNVNSVYKINNGYDYLAECVFPNIKELEDFVDNVEMRFKVRKCETYFIIEDIKRESFMSYPQTLDLIV